MIQAHNSVCAKTILLNCYYSSMNNIQSTFAFLKQECLKRNLIPQVLQRIQNAGLKFENMRMIIPTMHDMKSHYIEHQGKDFYLDLCERMTDGQILVMLITGDNAVEKLRTICGKTDCTVPGTIRGDFGTGIKGNIMHCSATVEEAKWELDIWDYRFND